MNSFKNNLIIIGSTLPYNFPADYIRKTASILSKKNEVIVFLWGDALSLKEIISQNRSINLIKKRKKITLFTPIHFIPLRRFEFIRQLNLLVNTWILKIFIYLHFKRINNKILWIFNYELYNLPKMIGGNYLSLYDCVEYPSSLDKIKEQEVRHKENHLLKNVDYLFVNSFTLKRKCQSYHSLVVPQGFSLETFLNKKQQLKKSKQLIKNKPLIGYIGSINYRLDFKLLIKLVKNNPQWNFIFIGQKQIIDLEDYYVKARLYLNKLLKLSNVYYLKNQTKKYVPLLINQFTICLIPYDISNSFNRFCYPMKLFEYFYLEKPVISTPILELKRLTPYVKIAKNAEEFEKEIKKVLTNGWPEKYKKEQKKLAIANSWQLKIEKISQILKKEWPEKFYD